MAVVGTLGPRLDRERFQWSSLLMLAPGLVLLVVLFLGPVLYAFYIGFTNLALVGSRSRDYSFTGLENVARILGHYVFIQSSRLACATFPPKCWRPPRSRARRRGGATGRSSSRC